MRGKWVVLAIALAGCAAWYLTRPVTIDRLQLAPGVPNPGHGELVFHAAGCASCHGEDLAGGLEMHTPFGIFRVPNISPDAETGIGNWSDLDFANAMLHGVSPSGAHYYPAFPYPSYARMEKSDLRDLKAYLDTLAPVSRTVEGHGLAFPYTLRRGVGLWKRRYLSTEPVIDAQRLSQQALRGQYLVEVLGHCGECHTPRDRFGGADKDRWLAGGANPNGEGRIPNITPHSDGLAGWSENDIAYYLESGFTPDFDTVGGSMVKVQENFARLPKSELQAVAAYLKAVAAQPDTP